jgi:hypothetical protein
MAQQARRLPFSGQTYFSTHYSERILYFGLVGAKNTLNRDEG